MKKISALILHSFRESFHSRVVFFLFLFIICMVLCSVFIRAADIEDRVKVMQSVSFIILGFFGSLLSLLLPVISISDEIETKKVYNILTKPVSRFTFLAGKLSGIMLFIFAFLAVMAFISYWFIIFSCPSDKRDRLFTADRFLEPVSAVRVRADSTRTEMTDPEIFSYTSEYASIQWMFRVSGDNAVRRGGLLKAEINILSRGVGIVYNIDFTRVFLRAVNPETGNVYAVTDSRERGADAQVYTILPAHETVDVFIPEEAVPSNGTLILEVLRPGSKYRLYPGRNSVRLYKPPGMYTVNFIKTFLFLFVKCVYIASVAMCGAAFFSMVSGITFGLFVIFMSYLIQFIKENAAPSEESVYHLIFFMFRFIAPDFSHYNRVDTLINGLYISWFSLFGTVAVAVCVYSFVYISIAYFGLKDREF